ncbi:unnamed protein product, partial [marine sediment metagenome]
MTDTIVTVPPAIQKAYPHMMPADIILWRTFLATEDWKRVRYAYDVHVG